MTVAHNPIPTEIRRIGKTAVVISWGDGHRSEYSNHDLRQYCPCASCRERPSRSLPVVGPGQQEIYPLQIGLVGRYAVSVQWSDGHDTGIYSYRTLRALCPCAQCRPTDVARNEGVSTSATADASPKEATKANL
jgi:DUF971 family protein